MRDYKKQMVILLLSKNSRWHTFLPVALQTSQMHYIIRKAARASRSVLPVLIEGEKGTGKKTLAYAIHDNSPRKSKPFIEIDCSVPYEEIRGILLGQSPNLDKTDRKRGKIVQAHTGSLLFENIHMLPEEGQKTLLRVMSNELNSSEGKKREYDVRILATSQVKLFDLVQKGLFNADLFYRLDIQSLSLPSLRDRKDDIIVIAQDFLHRYSEQTKKTIEKLDLDAVEVLHDYSWPGNLSELKTVIHEAARHCMRESISAQDIARAACEVGAFIRASSSSQTSSLTTVELFDPMGDLRPLIDLEAEIIRFALDHYNSQISEVSRRLGIGRSTLYRKMKEHYPEDAIH